MGEGHAQALEGVEGGAVEALPDAVTAVGQQQVGEVAVEEDAGVRVGEAQDRQARAQLVHEEHVGLQQRQLRRAQREEPDLQDQVQLA